LKQPAALEDSAAISKHPNDEDANDRRLDDARLDEAVGLEVAGRSLLSRLTDDMRGGD
jgi:hypothetical protein